MMTLRECVGRYGRLPQTLIVDGGPDFRSTYFETLVTYYGCEKKTRPGKPRYGSVIERLFGTANTQFVYNLIGNTQIMKQVRQVTKAIVPREQAVWTLGDLYAYLCIWAYEVYDQQIHPALGMSPREAFTMGIARGGAREHLKALYDDDFRYVSLASTRKKTAQIKRGRGVKINYVYYHAKAFDAREVENKQVPVRYDPFDLGTAYAYVQGRWVQAHSQHYLQLRGHTERELQLASAELHQQHRNHTRDAAITAKRLADFFADLESHETVLKQHWHDAEARDVFAQMEDSHVRVSRSPDQDQEERMPVLALVHTEASQEPTDSLVQESKSSRNPQGAVIIEDDADLEDRDEYEEFH